ncbi:hypothetical protein TrRE_jg1156, partial [Triparma retinervis]
APSSASKKKKKSNTQKSTTAETTSKTGSKTPTVPLTKPSRTMARMNYDLASDAVRTNLSVEVDRTSSLMRSTDSIESTVGKVVPSAPARPSSSRFLLPPKVGPPLPRDPPSLGPNEVLVSADYLLRKQATPLTFALPSPMDRGSATPPSSRGPSVASGPPAAGVPSGGGYEGITGAAGNPLSPSMDDGMRIEEEKLGDVSQEIAEDIKRASKRGGVGVTFKKIITPESVRRARMEISRGEGGGGTKVEVNDSGSAEQEVGEAAGSSDAPGYSGFRAALFLMALLVATLSSTKFVHPPAVNVGYPATQNSYEQSERVILMPPPPTERPATTKWFLSPRPSSGDYEAHHEPLASSPVVVVVNEGKAMKPVRRVINAVVEDVMKGGVKEALRFVLVSTMLNLGFGGVVGNPISRRIGGWIVKIGIGGKGRIARWGGKVVKKGVEVWKRFK